MTDKPISPISDERKKQVEQHVSPDNDWRWICQSDHADIRSLVARLDLAEADQCHTNPISSRACEKGTQSCETHHHALEELNERLADAEAALQTERERTERYRKALEFYRSKGSWECDRADFGSASVAVPHTSPIEYDCGEIARKALEEK